MSFSQSKASVNAVDGWKADGPNLDLKVLASAGHDDTVRLWSLREEEDEEDPAANQAPHDDGGAASAPVSLSYPALTVNRGCVLLRVSHSPRSQGIRNACSSSSSSSSRRRGLVVIAFISHLGCLTMYSEHMHTDRAVGSVNIHPQDRKGLLRSDPIRFCVQVAAASQAAATAEDSDSESGGQPRKRKAKAAKKGAHKFQKGAAAASASKAFFADL